MQNESYRQGDMVLTWSDTSKAYRILALTNSPELMYDYLASKGDRYASLANSVVKGDSFSGAFALNYLEEVMIENGQEINEDKLNQIRFDMAIAYLETLRSRFKGGVTKISGDINHKEGMTFHERVFEQHKLPIEAWTLQPVFDVLPNEETREVYWQKALDAVGNIEKETELSLGTLNMMFDGLYLSSASKQPQIHSWLRRVADLDNAVDGIQISLKNTYDFFETPKCIITTDYIKSLTYETGNPLIDRGTNRFSFWDFPSGDNNRFSVQTDWRGQTEFEHKNPLSDYYLEKPDYMLPETGLFDSPSINYKPDVEYYDRMIDNLRDSMSSMNNSMSSFDDRYSMPSMPSVPEFSYSGYSSGASFSFN
ncbi:serine protease [Providencia rettgeri]|uniref:serine protease n=1 Tax=Providencia rettgeri TaxID=587 RepID=UPI0023AA5C77|nr:serine protease [Providencia rettgeri]